uniref:Ionotropic glutamate receptor C-terminal domain-containing protein n=1 Tax=Phlebotomus papatasi TaxID=29031 RepID=A0A1B0EVZ2_PHLPP
AFSHQEQGRLSALKIKWWQEKRGGGACSSSGSDDGAERLDMANVGGVFFVLTCGSAFGVFYGCCEWLYFIRKRAAKKKVSLQEEFASEFKFVAACKSNVRVIRERSDEIDSQHSAISEASTKSRRNRLQSTSIEYITERECDVAQVNGLLDDKGYGIAMRKTNKLTQSHLIPISRAPSSRAVASIWSFFTLIMVSSYTANLAAFLTVESVYSPINNAEDLANAKGTIKYGAKRDGSTISFFKDAEYPIYQQMYKYMMDHPDMLTSSNSEGLSRVKSENYAFLMESTWKRLKLIMYHYVARPARPLHKVFVSAIAKVKLIHELSLMLGFNYTFNLQEDGIYGSKGEDDEWNGMIKELLEYRADLAITDLTITADREGAVDFTMPFMNLGISILYKKPSKEPPSLFSFMSPFSKEVWLYLGMAYLGVSLCLFILGRISPGEWDNPYPCIEEPTVLVIKIYDSL